MLNADEISFYRAPNPDSAIFCFCHNPRVLAQRINTIFYKILVIAKTVERAHERDAETNLMAIHAANRIYFTENGTYWPNTGVPQPLPNINTALRLSIVANGFTYVCVGNPVNYCCVALRDTGAYFVRVTEIPISPGNNPLCVNACP